MQSSNRLGCLTGAGVFATLFTVLVIAGMALFNGNQMFTAGALNAQPGEEVLGGVDSHAQITECSACHVAPWSADTMAGRCAKCHTDIAAQMFDVAKLHGAIMQNDSTLACRDCHPEHRGAAASLTEMGEHTFPHEALGFSLNGHQQTALGEAFSCKDCHPDDGTTFASDFCDDCHRQLDIVFTQAHVLSFGTDCLACHDGVDRYGDDFSHNQFAFQLIGKHAEAGCTECHLDARSISNLQSAPQDCFSCHQQDDGHDGRFGSECGVCHSSEGWEPAKFDHDLSSFKLDGEHSEAACEDCHINNVYKGTPSDCYSCHQKDDEHNGQFGTDCATCHTANDWDDANFDHSRTNFPLTGGHANTECGQCHRNGSFTGLATECVTCHADPVFHAGAFGNSCVVCHNSFGWSPAGFNIQHPEPNVDEGGSGVFHGGASCRECHPSTVYESSCISCHEGNDFEGGEDGEDDHD